MITQIVATAKHISSRWKDNWRGLSSYCRLQEFKKCMSHHLRHLHWKMRLAIIVNMNWIFPSSNLILKEIKVFWVDRAKIQRVVQTSYLNSQKRRSSYLKISKYWSIWVKAALARLNLSRTPKVNSVTPWNVCRRMPFRVKNKYSTLSMRGTSYKSSLQGAFAAIFMSPCKMTKIFTWYSTTCQVVNFSNWFGTESW